MNQLMRMAHYYGEQLINGDGGLINVREDVLMND
jgi:hypothetical protein